MENNRITALLDAARRKPLVAEELLQQRASFAHGNANLEGDIFSRATVTMVVLPDDTSDGSGPVRDVNRASLEGILRQYDLVVELIKRHTAPCAPRFVLTPDAIVDLQAALAYPGGPQPGYRLFSVRITMNDFEPIEPAKVSPAVRELCDYVNQNWDNSEPLALAAYVLWRLNWIHPFSDGNGRTARALSYLVLCVKLGILLPGTPTIPEQLLEQRADYYDALAKADEAYREHSTVDVSSVQELLSAMLLRQLDMVPALSSEEAETVEHIVDQRVRAAPADLVTKVFGKGKIEARIWSLDDHLVLQVGPSAAIALAEARHLTEASPFPKLLAPRGQNGTLRIEEDQHGLILRGRMLDAENGYALVMERNAAITIEQPHVVWGKSPAESWELEGALYVIRLGRRLALGRARRMFDILLARHMASLHP